MFTYALGNISSSIFKSWFIFPASLCLLECIHQLPSPSFPLTFPPITKTCHPLDHWTLQWKALNLNSRGSGSQNSHFWGVRILRAENLGTLSSRKVFRKAAATWLQLCFYSMKRLLGGGKEKHVWNLTSYNVILFNFANWTGGSTTNCK